MRSAMRHGLASWAAILSLITASATMAADNGTALSPGTVITAKNIDRLLEASYGGHRIPDMLPERIVWQIREHNLTIPLGEIRPHPIDPRYAELTRKYADQARLDADKKLVGWVGGVPFPELDPNDPDIAWKVIWNSQRGRQSGDSLDQPKFSYLLIDGNTGVERKQVWTYRLILLKGRVTGGAPSIGEPDAYQKSLIVALAPQDIKGVGTFAIRYNTGKVDDSWAYVRDVRRVRRLSASAWMDPIGSTDELGDDFGIFGAYPTWYADYKFLGKTTILAVANSISPQWNEDASNIDDEFPGFDLTNRPHWNPINDWEPREVYVIEGTPEPEHPYSRKVGYIDAKTWNVYYGEAFDKSGEFWKSMYQGIRVWPDASDPEGDIVWPNWGSTIDFQKYHGTIFTSHPSWLFGSPVTEEDVSLTVLEAQGR
ncbi:MAG: DUF1329 domain-containing protein [Alphaproteobacteria bacterium]